ncbi:hypothetical protein [Caulobacter sp. RHG1]|nr:hypothetical protein [Caulobacter sp. RHG1]
MRRLRRILRERATI